MHTFRRTLYYYLLATLFSIVFFTACTGPLSNNGQPGRASRDTTKRPGVIAILPYKGADQLLIPFIQSEIGGFYHTEVAVLPTADLPDFAWYAARGRYKADSLLVFQRGMLMPKHLAIVGITDKDISTSHDKARDWGVFGPGLWPV